MDITASINVSAADEIREEIQDYIDDHNITDLLNTIVRQVCTKKPSNPAQLIAQITSDIASTKQKKQHQIEDDEDEDEDEDTDMHTIVKETEIPKYVRKRRCAFSSEPAVELENVEIHTPAPKSDDSIAKIDKALQGNVLCSYLDESERREILDAMFAVTYNKDDVIIKQGDENGDRFYIVDDGECDIYVTKDGERKNVLHVTTGGSFGELALIYNTPRAADVIASTNVKCFCIDRVTYRRVLMDSTMRKRKMYEEFLDKVPILGPLEKYERLTVADALETENFKDGDVVVKQGDSGDVFYIIVDGNATVTQKQDDGDEKVVGKLAKSDYFGEIALLTDRPRAATVVADGELKCVRLDRDRFIRVLGPCEDILRRNMQAYNQYFNQ